MASPVGCRTLDATMSLPVLPTSIIDGDVHARTVERFRAQRISLPTFAEIPTKQFAVFLQDDWKIAVP